jgi:hypothetical protein
MKRPVSLIVIGILFILGGAPSLWKAIQGLFTLNFNLDPTPLLFFVGIGLLKLKPSSRRWAIRWIIFGYFLCAFITLFSLFNESPTHGNSTLIQIVGLNTLLLVWIHLILRKSEIVALFEKSE